MSVDTLFATLLSLVLVAMIGATTVTFIFARRGHVASILMMAGAAMPGKWQLATLAAQLVTIRFLYSFDLVNTSIVAALMTAFLLLVSNIGSFQKGRAQRMGLV